MCGQRLADRCDGSAGRDHQIVNTGAQALAMVATFSASPVGTAQPDGQAIELPWAS
jgi:hypothetical protein